MVMLNVSCKTGQDSFNGLDARGDSLKTTALCSGDQNRYV